MDEEWRQTLNELFEILKILSFYILVALATVFFLFVFCSKADAGLWDKVKDGYKEGVKDAEYERIEKSLPEDTIKRIEDIWREVMHQKIQQEKYMSDITKGIKDHLSKGNSPSHYKLYVAGGALLILYLCHRGGVGCDRDDDDNDDE